jgi:phospholipid-transporting ATPase
MQTIKSISISNGVPASAYPLAAVVFVAMLKDAFEDYKRNKSDNEENFKATKVYRASSGTFEDVIWKDLKPGNIVKVSEDEAIPADLCLLGSSDAKGTLYIETKNLDGETNLKNKYVHKDINERIAGNMTALQTMKGSIYSEAPNNAIYKFEGQFL